MRIITSLIFLAFLLSQCAVEKASEINVAVANYDDAISLPKTGPVSANSHRKELSRNSRATFVAHQAKMLVTSIPEIDSDLRNALLAQKSLLKRQSAHKEYVVNGKTYKREDFLNVIDDLLEGKYHEQQISTIPVARLAEVRFTGYYSPEILVSKKKTKKYKYPILEYPSDFKEKLPSRRVIESGKAFKLDDYAIAYAEHPLDVYNLQLQGSGFVKYLDGERKYLAYGGTNRYPYQSIERAVGKLDSSFTDLSMRSLRTWVSAKAERDTITRFNPNYGFFKVSKGKARGAVGVPLTPMVSVAADPEYYPLGSVLLASVPVTGKKGVFETRVLLVQDTGGAVKGKRHLDMYMGVGESALDAAEVTNDYGQVFILAAK